MTNGIRTSSIMTNLLELNYGRRRGIIKYNLFLTGATTIKIKTLSVMTLSIHLVKWHTKLR